jgi:membrane associated rhomboid family serine protease
VENEPMNKTIWLIILFIVASLLTWFLGSDQIVDYLVFSGENLLKGRVWTVITGLFLHADPTHLIGNMVFFYIFGNTIEKELGDKWVLIPFFVGGVASFLLSTLFYDPTVSMVGASAAIFTLTAIVMLLKPLQFSFYFLMPLGLVAIIYFSYNLLAAQMGIEGSVSYIGHIIGFSIGVPFGIASSKDWHKNLLITALLFMIYLLVIWIVLPAIGINT